MHEIDPFWITWAIHTIEVENDKDVERARARAKKKADEKAKKGPLSDVSFDAPGQPGDPNAAQASQKTEQHPQ